MTRIFSYIFILVLGSFLLPPNVGAESLDFEPPSIILSTLERLAEDSEFRVLPVTLKLLLETQSAGPDRLELVLSENVPHLFNFLESRTASGLGIEVNRQIEQLVPENLRHEMENPYAVLVTGPPLALMESLRVAKGWVKAMFWTLEHEIEERTELARALQATLKESTAFDAVVNRLVTATLEEDLLKGVLCGAQLSNETTLKKSD